MHQPWQDESIIALSQRLQQSFAQLLGHPLDTTLPTDPLALAEALYHAPYVVLAHNGQSDPQFIYANLTAQKLWELPWDEFIGMPSRLSAEADLREVRARMLKEVEEQGYIDNYSGVRISKSGKRFELGPTTVWNLLDESGTKCGQAATFSSWTPLSN